MAPPEGPDSAAAAAPLPPGQTVPGILLRVLRSNPALAATPEGLLVLTAHASMLETGFAPAAPAAEGNGYSLPPGCQLSPSLYRLPYRLSLHGDGAPACTLTCSGMGGALLAAAATPAGTGGARHVTLRAADYVEHAPQQAQQAQAGPDDASAGVAVPGGRDVVVGGRLAVRSSALRALWTALKDGVAFPIMLAACADAGLPPPLGLIALPAELKQRVLQALPGPDLAALSAACTQLRHLASVEALWRPLLAAEFPSPPPHVASQAAARGAKWAFGQCWRERARREEEAAEARRRRQRLRAAPAPMFGPRPPFYPPPAPPGFPGTIGGEQDRLPFLGGGGIYPGGFGLGLGGGGARRGGAGGFPGF
jgi:hypothetical protein